MPSDLIYNIVQTIVILLIAITWHELAHALTAQYLGDDTPRLTGHLSLNPFRHMDQYGIILLFISVIALRGNGGFAYGFTPVTERNLRPNSKVGGGIVAIVGPLSNIVLAALFAVPLRFGLVNQFSQSQLYTALEYGVFLNILLAVFNIIPIPPLDGWRVLQTFLSPRQLYELRGFEQYGPMVLSAIFLLSFVSGGSFFYDALNQVINPISQFLVGF